jgi:hypothetical protein
VDVESIVAELRSEVARISQVIGLLGGNTPTTARVGRPAASAQGSSRAKRRGGLTPAGRRKLSLAMKRRWAQRRGATGASRAKTALAAATKPKKRGGITPAGRKRLAEAMRKRWAEKKRKAS